MSNSITQLKKKSKRTNTTQEDIESLKAIKNIPIRDPIQLSKDGKVDLNIANRNLPNSLYCNVRTGIFKLGSADKPIKDCDVVFQLTPNQENYPEMLKFLEELNSTGNIAKVVLDNETDFKILSMEEMVTSVKREIEKHRQSVSANPGEEIS